MRTPATVMTFLLLGLTAPLPTASMTAMLFLLNLTARLPTASMAAPPLLVSHTAHRPTLLPLQMVVVEERQPEVCLHLRHL